MRRFLDTNAYAALKRGDAATMETVRRTENLFVSVIVLGELYFGFHDGNRLGENLTELEELLAHPFVEIAFLTPTTADRFGRISSALKRAGTPIPTNDVWIAAQTLERGAELITLDSHFEVVPGLVIAGRS